MQKERTDLIQRFAPGWLQSDLPHARAAGRAHQTHEMGQFSDIVHSRGGRWTREHRSACKRFMFRAFRAFRGLSFRVDAAG